MSRKAPLVLDSEVEHELAVRITIHVYSTLVCDGHFAWLWQGAL
jgi:hypothetical protein